MVWELEIMVILVGRKIVAQLCQMKFNSFYDNIRSTNQPNRPSAKHFQHFKTKINRAIIDNYFYLESDET